MGLFSRKKKLTKEERKEADKAFEDLQKIKEQRKISDEQEISSLEKNKETDFDEQKYKISDEENQKLQEQIKKGQKDLEISRQRNQEKFNKHASSLKRNSHLSENSPNTQQDSFTCSVSDCTKKVDFFTGKKCKVCDNLYCLDHLIYENHGCVKPTLAREHLRKTWLRKYGVNISSGRYIVVCDECGWVSKYGSLIDIAGDEREHHLENSTCNSKKVWLEEDRSDQKVDKDIDLETVVPTDRTFWVCAHCRPPQKFTDRAKYISHHYFHS